MTILNTILFVVNATLILKKEYFGEPISNILFCALFINAVAMIMCRLNDISEK
jgi:hypothetical protein